jgi:phosphatidylglycerophosphate synthase
VIPRVLVLAPPPERDFVVTGLTLSERARRVARLAGVSPADIFVVRAPAELAAHRGLRDAPLLVVRADGWVVAGPLLEPLRIEHPGSRRAVDEQGMPAGALRVDAAQVGKLLDALGQGWDAVDSFPAEPVTVGRRARHPAHTPAEVRAADAWQFELVNKPLDAPITRLVYRPLARPLTRLFLRSPLSPNAISVLSALLSLTGCAIASQPSYFAHVGGLVVLFLGGIVDCNDGEVARLRLEYSKLGGWLDAIGDDMARLALLFAVGIHVAPRWPQIPVLWITFAAFVLTLTAMLLIYWYCIFVIHSSNNQEYGAALGIGPGVGGERSLLGKLGDFGAQIARRDAMDLGILGFAILGLPEVSWLGLVIGAIVGIAIVVPTHFKLVALHRAR